MLDLAHITSNPKADVQIFNANAAALGVGWHTWVKPRGVNFVHFFCLAGGGGGGSGFAGAASAAGGGGGGGSGAQASIVFPSWSIPDVLFISVGYGGNGGTSTTIAGSAGVDTYISIDPSVTANNLLMICKGGGTVTVAGAGTAAGGGAAGIGGVASTIANAPLAALGQIMQTVAVGNINIAGQQGVTGAFGVNAVGALTLPVTGLVVTGGGGGAGLGPLNTAGTAGGSFTVAGTFPAHAGGSGGAANNTTGGGTGANGYQAFRGLTYYYGGAGGGSSGLGAAGAVANTGGTGGSAGFGAGGGGGGGGFTGSGGGRGGNGGNGIVVATSW